MKPLVFYFTFDDPETDELSLHGFVIEDPTKFYESLDVSNFDDFDEIAVRLYEVHTEEIEAEYGVHDWSSRPSEAVDAIGYTTYEVESDRIPDLMNEWRNRFVSAGCVTTEVQRLDSETFGHGNDEEIYLLLGGKQQPAAPNTSTTARGPR
jgi:hypothetical protein